ncbi:unnamed protein product [Ambrosiozyma monospora]|uniref:Unnamed protein product n=1 Tax=Ambrosiozyma monospora TaxID=43982 RepID=A0ACB5T047_AMBMO|nr:unnamed protein product [Ambrosiozyma monospora]
MGRYSKKNRGGNKLGRRDNRENWKEIEKENANWEKFYKIQGIIPEDQFELFKTTCQTQLPLTFRVTGSKKHAHEISQLFIDNHLPSLSKIEGSENYKPPFAFPWYPNNLGFQIDLPKSVVRKNAEFAKTQRFLVTETEVGNISRQEAVSMIPPLVLDVKPHHYVLDMCAAPGSKTSQLIEALHAEEDEPTGFVMANDADYKRSHMLIHQIKRLNSANFVVVNHDAQMFPKIKLEEDGDYIKFDRVLCDVPCTGDATMRKNMTVWKDWRVGNAIGLHPLQLNILMRGLQLLKFGGRLVYSTCSMNPMENEAIVAAALRKWGGKVRTVKCDDLLPGLIRHPGLSQWKVLNKQMEIQEPGTSEMLSSFFPPTAEEAAKFNLDNCMRVYPHDQNTGGFFITVLEKIDPEAEKKTGDKREATEEVEDGETEKKQKAEDTTSVKPTEHVKQRKEKLPRDACEEPFNFLQADNPELVKCWDFYEIKDTFAKDCTLVRNATGEALRSIYYVSPIIKKILTVNEQKLKLIFADLT